MPSFQYRATQPVMRFMKWLMPRVQAAGPQGLVTFRRRSNWVASRLTSFPPDLARERGNVAGVAGWWMRVSDAPPSPVVLYIHGGALWVDLGAPFQMVAAHIARASRLPVFAIDYRTSPEHRYPAAHDDCYSVYRELTAKGTAPLLVGESSGGVLALATMLRARRDGVALPRECTLLSPTVDYGFRDDGVRRANDAFVDASFVIWGHALYMDGHDPECADLAPIDEDLSGLPPLYVVVGEHELFRTEADRLVAAARRYAVPVELETWPQMWHGLHVMADRLPEGRAVLEKIGERLGRAAK